MKKLLFALFLTCFVSATQAQVGIFYVDANQKTKLSTSRVTGKKVGNIVGAYFTLGLSAANNNMVVEGKEAQTVIRDEQPSFEINFGEDRNTGYVLSDVANMDKIVLIKLRKKGKSRNLRIGKYGLIAGVQSGISEDDMVPLDVDNVSDSMQIVRPKEKLKKGDQYCFYFAGETPEGEKPFNYVFDFSVK